MENFNLFFMLKLALKHWVVLVLAAVISAGTVYGYFNYVAEPKYTAKGAVVITNGGIISQTDREIDAEIENKLESSDISTSYGFLDTAVDYLEDQGIYRQLAEVLENKYTFSQLKSRTSVSRREDKSLFIDVSYTCNNGEEALLIVNEFIKLVPDFIEEHVPNTAVYYSLAYGSSLQRPSNSSLILIAGILGAAAVYLVIFLIYSADNIIRDEENFKDHIDAEIIGVVPDFAMSKLTEKKYSKYNKYYYGYGGK